MGSSFTVPIQRVSKSFPEKRDGVVDLLKKPIDSKVKGYVLGKIGTGAKSGALLPTATAPRIMFNLLSAALAVSNIEEDEGEKEISLMTSNRRKKRGKLRRVLKRVAPIGLKRSSPHDWINAWMQFLLYLPGTLELFSFLPRSLEPFREFRDQYLADAYEKEEVSFANGSYLVRILFKILSSDLFKNTCQVDPYEVLKCFTQAAFPIEQIGRAFGSILFHFEKHLIWDSKSGVSLDKLLAEKLLSKPQEILVSLYRERLKDWEMPRGAREFESGIPALKAAKLKKFSAKVHEDVSSLGWGGGGSQNLWQSDAGRTDSSITSGIKEKPSSHVIKRQIFDRASSSCYELDAFIEYRPDLKKVANYVAYLKVDGLWYQCDDERVTTLLSTNLHVPLQNGVLLHYQKVVF